MLYRACVRRRFSLLVLFGALLFLTLATSSPASPVTVDGDLEVMGVAPSITFDWQVVVNNGVQAPYDPRPFNSYNQPSLNVDRLVVFRARTKGGMGSGYGPPVHGIFTRDMSGAGAPVRIFDRRTLVPEPNNTSYPPTGPLAMFIEPPSFPRIDMWSGTIATRGNHQPVWNYSLEDGTETRAGTTGIYTNPFGSLIVGASNLGAVPGFGFFAVPDTDPAIKFDVFPGAPAVADGSTIVFKGNYTTSEDLSMTGVYYRDLADAPIELPNGTYLEPGGGMGPVVLIADTNTLIPGSKTTTFGSTAPPTAVGREAVFAGFDNEASPTEGGIYLAPLKPIDKKPRLTPLVEIGDQVPGERKNVRFNRLGEGVSFDGRFVAFWGAWGTETKTLVLQCPTEGNKDRIAFCNEEPAYKDGFPVAVPVNQGIFVHDTVLDLTSSVAKTPNDYADLVYWNFSGRVPGMGEGGGDDDTGEPARWRSATFLAVSGLADGTLDDATFHAAFKARTGEVVDGAYGDPADGIYLGRGPGSARIVTMVETGMDGTLIDPAALDSETAGALPVTEMGIERDGFRGDALAINLRMGAEETGWAGIYLTTVPEGLK